MSDRLEHLEKQILSVEPLVMIGDAVGLHPSHRLFNYAEKISGELSKRPHTMLQYSPANILKAMMGGRAILATDLDSNGLLGFAQLWKFGVSPDKKDIYEFGSWLSFAKGSGRQVLTAGTLLGSQIDSSAQVIAIVEDSNVRAQDTIKSTGGVFVTSAISDKLVTLQGRPAQIKIYDITKRH